MGAFSRRSFLWTAAGYTTAQALSAQPLVPGTLADTSLERRLRYLEVLRELLPPPPRRPRGRINSIDATWDAWQKRTGELPPDFVTLPAHPILQSPLSGIPNDVTTAAQWPQRRGEIRKQVEYWLTGPLPPRPDNLTAVIQAAYQESDISVRDVELQFGPEARGRLHLQLLIPPGRGPFPVLVTNHPRKRPWVNTAVRRGYAGCIIQAIDSLYNEPDDSDSWADLYPDYDFAAVARWAWGAMRAVDYLESVPEIDSGKIAIGGHSRNAKAALFAAALDERFGAVVPSRGNAGESFPWVYNTELFAAQDLNHLTASFPYFFHPRLRFFIGQEHKLPVDQHHVMSLIAPRGLLMSHAVNEHEGNTFAFEQAYRSVRTVYDLLGHPERLNLYQQPGEHPSTAADIELYFDFFDSVFGRGPAFRREDWVFGYDLEKWKAVSGRALEPSAFPVRETGGFATGGLSPETWPAKKSDIQNRINVLLGETPPALPYFPKRPNTIRIPGSVTTDDGHLGALLERPLSGRGFRGFDFPFGDDLKADLYLKADANNRVNQNTKYPLIVLLHPYAYSLGYSHQASDIRWLTYSGYAVLSFDQIGFGARSNQALRFYDRYPRWSLLGKMVTDTRAALDSLWKLGLVDTSRVYLLGEGLGAKVALLTAAMDERPAAVIAGNGFAPLRLDRPEKGTEGIRHYTEMHGLLPHLHKFAGQEARLPVDWDEVLAAVAPRPTLIHAPTMDRYHPVDDVRKAVDAARQVYGIFGQSDALELRTPVDFGRTSDADRLSGFDWLAARAGMPTYAELEKSWSQQPQAPAAEDEAEN